MLTSNEEGAALLHRRQAHRPQYRRLFV